jgi:hypothetical protein
MGNPQESMLPIILPLEEMVDEIGRLAEPSHVNLDGATIIKGEHPQHGPVTIVMPAFGNSIMMSLALVAITALFQFLSCVNSHIV